MYDCFHVLFWLVGWLVSVVSLSLSIYLLQLKKYFKCKLYLERVFKRRSMMLQVSFGSSIIAITMLLSSIPKFIRKLKSHSSLLVTTAAVDDDDSSKKEVGGPRGPVVVEGGGVAKGTVIGESVDEIDDLDDDFTE